MATLSVSEILKNPIIDTAKEEEADLSSLKVSEYVFNRLDSQTAPAEDLSFLIGGFYPQMKQVEPAKTEVEDLSFLVASFYPAKVEDPPVDLSFLGASFYPDKSDTLRERSKEKNVLQEFVDEKSKKFGIQCTCLFTPDVYEMSVDSLSTLEYQININPLFLLTEENIEAFLAQYPGYRDSIKTFLSQKKPELLDEAAASLISWFNANSKDVVPASKDNKGIAKELLVLHATGNLSSAKRFLLAHEMGHARESSGVKSLGYFDPLKLNFIKAHQYREVRADLTAARELDAHDLAVAHFEWRSIIFDQPGALQPHPSDANRAKAIQMDKTT